MASIEPEFEDDEIQEEFRGSLDVQARLLYGLIHARWIITSRGLAKMVSTVFFLAHRIDRNYDLTAGEI